MIGPIVFILAAFVVFGTCLCGVVAIAFAVIEHIRERRYQRELARWQRHA